MKYGMAFLSALLITGATSIAAAQSGNTGQGSGQGQGQGSGQQGSGQGGQAQGGQRGATPGQTGATTGSRELFLQRGERVVGVDVADSAGGSLGRVDDVVILSTGEIGYVVLQAPGEGGTKQYPIPWSQMHTQPPTVGGTGAPGSADAARSEKLKVGFGKDRLKSAPSFEGNQWPKEGTTTVFSNADTFYGESAGAAKDASGMTKGRAIDASALKSGSFRLTQIKGLQIVDGTGNPVGTIDQVVVDPVDGRVNYIAVRMTAPAANGRVIAMPWNALRVSRQDDKTRLQSTLSTEMLMKAPEFKTGEESWKQMSEPRWVNDLYSYYSVKPYWSTTPAGADAKGTGADSKPKTPDDKKTPPDEKKKTPPDDKDPH